MYTQQDAYAGLSPVPQTPAELLAQARVLISEEKNWGQFRYEWCPYVGLDQPRECKRCAIGALMHATGQAYVATTGPKSLNSVYELEGDARSYLRREVYARTGHKSITGYNDSHTHAQVLEVFDAAIAAAKASE